MADIEKQMLMNQETKEIKYPTIFLLGAQGVGKSTLGNMLLGIYSGNSETKVSPIFPVSDGGDDEKEEEIYRTAEINIKGKKYSIIDTIGIPEISNSSDEVWNKLKQVEKKAKAVKAYIFVLEGGRLTQHGLLFIHQLFTKYPKERTIVIFTKVRKSLILSNTEMKKTFNTQISTLLQTINDRWLVMPSLDLFGNDEGKSVIERFVDDLKDMIVKIDDKGKGIDGKFRIDSRLSFIGSQNMGNMGMGKNIACSFVIIIIVIIITVIIIKFVPANK